MKPRLPQWRDSADNREVLFCTQCGATLDEFCFSEDAGNLDAVKANFARCKHTGKFNGELCAKVYIAGTRPPEPTEDEPPTKPKSRPKKAKKT